MKSLIRGKGLAIVLFMCSYTGIYSLVNITSFDTALKTVEMLHDIGLISHDSDKQQDYVHQSQTFNNFQAIQAY
ncbi:MAG: hypothetical protein HRT38_13630 [Alteromonadaceae bacterium]|nr:hypothetical protein [Alteromonadaceae bacterium]